MHTDQGGQQPGKLLKYGKVWEFEKRSGKTAKVKKMRSAKDTR